MAMPSVKTEESGIFKGTDTVLALAPDTVASKASPGVPPHEATQNVVGNSHFLQHETQLLGLLVRMADQMVPWGVFSLIWVKTGEAGAKGYDQEGGFLQRSKERERGLVAGARACCPRKEEVLGCMGSTCGL